MSTEGSSAVDMNRKGTRWRAEEEEEEEEEEKTEVNLEEHDFGNDVGQVLKFTLAIQCILQSNAEDKTT